MDFVQRMEKCIEFYIKYENNECNQSLSTITVERTVSEDNPDIVDNCIVKQSEIECDKKIYKSKPCSQLDKLFEKRKKK